MALYGKHPSLKLAEDPTDPVWRWFILNGPHGERFEWVRFGDLPRDIEYLKCFMETKGQKVVLLSKKVDIANDAKCSLFERGIKVKRES